MTEEPSLQAVSFRQLRQQAAEMGIAQYARMSKTELARLLSSKKKPGMDPKEIDQGDLPVTYGENRIVLLPRDPRWTYAYWEVSEAYKATLRHQGGQQLALRLYDVTDINFEHQLPHRMMEFLCDELARDWYLPIPESDRSYLVEIGYRCSDDRWLLISRSRSIHVPPIYPFAWDPPEFLTLPLETALGSPSLDPFKKQDLSLRSLANRKIDPRLNPPQISSSIHQPASSSTSLSPLEHPQILAHGSGQGYLR
jgi:hypothetical protein